ncbi:hypothetical protein niasHS_000942 [Heterodera schachtii]|uniref:Uncharacterized protein n=1 Tax=Heterodera schachtii TaxID=97005 RepID=A0ABD2K7S4_HETSC
MGVFVGTIVCLMVALVRCAVAQFPQNPVPIGTVIVAEQHFATTTQMPLNPASELVDQVESIDVSSTQMIITTTRQGPPDTARVAISIVDTVTGEELPPMNLTGVLLVLTRGRYTVNWLQPNRWYGVNFRAEQHYAGGSAVYTNEEAHLVKTRRVDGSHDEGNSVVSVRAERYGEHGRSLENLVLTMRWEQHPDERPNLDALANITLFCDEQIKYKKLHLRGREIDKSVEIRLENDFEVTEQRNGTVRKMVASIKPKNCLRICWSAELIAETRKQTFRRSAANHCEQIEPISASTQLREFVGYEIAPNGDLIVNTNFSDSEEKSEEADAYVQLTAIEIPERKMAENNGTVRFKTFNTKKEGEQYVLNNMELGKLYAVQYTYGKQSPFAYEESRRFLLDMASGMQPVHMQFNLTEPYSQRPGVIATAWLDPMFKQYEVGIDVDPLCELNESTVHFWLTKDRPEKEINEPRLLDALCTAVPGHSVCTASGAGGTRSCGMTEGKLCYTVNIVVHGKIFSAPRECASLADQVPPVPSTTTTTTTTTASSTTKSTSATHAKSSPHGATPTAPQNASGTVSTTEVPNNASNTKNASVGPKNDRQFISIFTIFLLLLIPLS